MKIVCMIRESAPLHYFVNSIHRHHSLVAVVVERPKPKSSLVKRVRKMGVKRALNRLKQRLCPVSENEKSLYNDLLGNDWRSIDSSIPEIIVVSSVNDSEVLQLLARIKPDLLLDHGTSIVKQAVLGYAKCVLNLHWGLSPYYRGTFCTHWALINWDPYNIGVTIHSLTDEIDGGGIVAQRRVDIDVSDSVESINLKLTKAGTDLCRQIISSILDGNHLRYYQQDFANGYLTFLRQWTDTHDRLIEEIENQKIIPKMLKNPARQIALPIVEFDQNEKGGVFE